MLRHEFAQFFPKRVGIMRESFALRLEEFRIIRLMHRKASSVVRTFNVVTPCLRCGRTIFFLFSDELCPHLAVRFQLERVIYRIGNVIIIIISEARLQLSVLRVKW